ncbi:phenylalanine 4-monooxygenase [Cryomorpha ignava]|uniref:Phenylalanine-4-hydroxylase n=1 Tax=Cryomorpha ignava TaxID=101383 RepID=A0A7K3WNU3_9FLAO|nr:phenylalanine 4-monooxygenase [Cryomorpha ignava]NEN23164.1 phenylalanine 4-monooxygenase [Cryomorpha ignava]
MMIQTYSAYTDEDFAVWKLLYSRQMEILPKLAAKEYLDALERVNFTADRIPHFNEVNKLLGETTGWKIDVVPHIIPVEEFFPKLERKTFGATTWLRKMSELDYLEEPDMFHDVFGHVPLLSNTTFCAFFHGLSKIAMKHLDNPEILEKLGRMYWFTIEFGLIRESGDLKIYGAGIMSSHGETKYSVSNEPTHLPFDVKTILNKTYNNMIIQDTYFVIDSFEQLFDSLGEIERQVDTSD